MTDPAGVQGMQEDPAATAEDPPAGESLEAVLEEALQDSQPAWTGATGQALASPVDIGRGRCTEAASSGGIAADAATAGDRRRVANLVAMKLESITELYLAEQVRGPVTCLPRALGVGAG